MSKYQVLHFLDSVIFYNHSERHEHMTTATGHKEKEVKYGNNSKRQAQTTSKRQSLNIEKCKIPLNPSCESGMMVIPDSKGAGNVAFDKVSYDRAYIKEHYDQVSFTVPKGKRDELKALAKSNGQTITELIVDAVFKQYGLNLSK